MIEVDSIEFSKKLLQSLSKSQVNKGMHFICIDKRVKEGGRCGFVRSKKEGMAFAIAHTNHTRAMRLLFKMLENHIQEWWD